MWQSIGLFLRTLISKKETRPNRSPISGAPIETVIQSFPDAMVLYDTSFTILSLNHAAETLFGVTKEEVQGARVDPGWVEKPHYRTLTQTLFPSLAPASTERSEIGVWPQVVSLIFENPHRELTAYTTRITDAIGGSSAFVKIIRDETRTKEVLSTRNEFVGIAAHQLRTPLTALRWSLESIGGSAEKKEEVAPLIKDSLALVDRCLKIVNDFLDAAKIEEGKFGFEYQNMDVVTFLDALVTTIAPIAKQYEVGLYFDHEGFGAVTIPIDPSRLGTAFLNLLDNAVRYNVRGGKVTLTLIKEPNQVKVLIADTGIGIPKGEERKLFQKLERGSNAIQIEPNGSGLGLYIAKNIVEGHGGTITVASETNRGTTFTVALPLKNNR